MQFPHCRSKVATPDFSKGGILQVSPERSSLNPTPLTQKLRLRSGTSGYLNANSFSPADAVINLLMYLNCISRLRDYITQHPAIYSKRN